MAGFRHRNPRGRCHRGGGCYLGVLGMRGPPIRAGKRDANEREIIDALEAIPGCIVAQETAYDLRVQTPAGYIVMLEVKNGRGRITDSQQEMLDAGWKLHIVRTPDEAIAVVREADEKAQ